MNARRHVFLATSFAALLGCLARAQQLIDTLPGNFAEDRFGWSVAALGDIDGDDRPDYAIGALRDDDGGLDSGTIRIVSGATRAEIYTVFGAPGDRVGYSIGACGDINGDGVPDFMGGAPDASFEQGYGRVFSGATGATLYTLTAPTDGTAKRMGEAVSGAGDADLDGMLDFAVGSSLELHALLNKAGRVRVYSGATGNVLQTVGGTSVDANFGSSIAVFDDLIGSGYPDLLVGAPGTAFGGAAHVISMMNGGFLLNYFGIAGLDRFGTSVAVLGDIDGDGISDFVVGAPQNDSMGNDAGAAYVVRGIYSTTIHTFLGAAAGDRFGSVVSRAGDLDGDGIVDIHVGAPQNDLAGSNAGAAYIRSGASGTLLYSMFGGAAFDQFGRSGAGVGDGNGDGIDEVVIGAGDADLGGNLSGAAYVYTRDCGTFTSVGAGCPTSLATNPTLSMSGCFVGGGIVKVAISDGVPGGVALLFLGVSGGPLNLPGGCALHLFPFPSPIGLPLSGSGGIAVAATLPAGVTPISLAFQALMGDPGVTGGVAATNAIQLVP